MEMSKSKFLFQFYFFFILASDANFLKNSKFEIFLDVDWCCNTMLNIAFVVLNGYFRQIVITLTLILQWVSVNTDKYTGEKLYAIDMDIIR
jgi:hypothetical protein